MAKSYVIHGWPVDVDLHPEKTSFVLGEPIYIDFRVRSRAPTDLVTMQGGDTINPLGRHDRFRVTAFDRSGAAVRSPLDGGAGVSGGNSFEGPQKIPHGGEWTNRLLLQDWATIGSPGSYTITCNHDLVLARSGEEAMAGKLGKLAVTLSAPIEVLPADGPALGRVIEEYGKQAAGGRDDSDAAAGRALAALTTFDDVRAVPYLITAATNGTYSAKFAALGALARFDDDRALHAMEAGLHDADPNLQAAAANALARGKHPRALESLWAARKGASEAVRLTLVHAIAKSASPTALTRLEELSRDPSPIISSEAKRYIKERSH